MAGAAVGLASVLSGCGPSDESTEPPACVAPLETGDPAGHPDPFGAQAAGEARAARLDSAMAIAQPAHGRQPIVDGDYVLINEHLAAVIEGARLSDGYGRFGGEIIALDRVGDDGMPMGLSRYGESLVGLGINVVDPDDVSVLRDGSDGGPAVVRAVGTTRTIPFMDGVFSGLLPADHELEVALDYVLEPGARQVTLRWSVRNPSMVPFDFGVETVSEELYAFFHTNQNQLFTPERAFDAGEIHEWVGFVSEAWSFAFRPVDGPFEYGLDQSGFYLFHAPGFVAEGCAVTTSDRAELFAGGPELDGLREAMRTDDDAMPWDRIEGTVRDAGGAPIADAWVHGLDTDEIYLTRTKTDDQGNFTIHLPAGAPGVLAVQKRGFPIHRVDATSMQMDITMPAHGLIHVTARDGGDQALPVRVQVVPETPPEPTPEGWGVLDEVRGRLHQRFAVEGDTTLVVPPGQHRVIVSRGYEYELVDTTVDVAAGATVDVDAVLERSVDSTGVMCADFHIHSFLSADSPDPIEHKVKGAVADGLEIPVSSEHEWIVDFNPVVKALGLSDWAFGMASSELTTFTYGHFGVVPLRPEPGAYNNGAIDWIDRTPAEVFEAVDARPEAPFLIVNHPRSTGIGGYFSSASLEDGTSDADLWSNNFDGIEAFNDSDFDENRDAAVQDWFDLLNAGEHKVAVGSSDSHKLRTSPVGYPRTCLYFGHDDPSALEDLDVRDALLAGDAVVSGGLFMTVRGPGDAHPGATVTSGSASFDVTVEAPSWLEAETLEVIVSGETVDTITLSESGGGPSNLYTETVSLDLSAGDWVVFHADGGGDLAPLHPGREPFAVSNPIFVE